MKKHKSLLIILLILSMVFTTLGCTKKSDVIPSKDSGTLTIYTTFYPLYDFTKKIAGDKVEVINLTPAGVEPHDFELSPKQVAMLYDADVFIFLGEAMEPWAKKLQDQLTAKGVTVVEAGNGLIQENDPHIWLDPSLAKEVSTRIYEGISSVDPEKEPLYQENLASLLKKFDELDKELVEVFSQAKKREVVTDHAILGYLARRYDLNPRAVTGLSPQEEPSPKRMAELAEFCKTHDVKYIFTQRGESSKLSETLAHEVGADILELNPLESLTEDELKAGEDYFSIMEKNLIQIKKALWE